MAVIGLFREPPLSVQYALKSGDVLSKGHDE